MTRLRLHPILSLAAGLCGCVVHVPEPTLEMARGDPSVLAALEGGYETYRDKCSGCHALYPVERYNDDEWACKVDKMVRLNKVRFEPGQRERLLEYLSQSVERE